MNLAEGVQLVSFGLLSVLMIGAALGVVLLENIVYSAFLLGMVFVSMAGMYILLNAGFLAAAQVLIYVGAVNVLILFGIMLVNKRQEFAPMPRAWLGKISTAAVCVGLFALLASTVLNTNWRISSEMPAGDGAVELIGKHFFSDFLLPFELASVLLLMALVGAIILARREFIPETQVGETDPLRLPERPRELVSAANSDSDSA